MASSHDFSNLIPGVPIRRGIPDSDCINFDAGFFSTEVVSAIKRIRMTDLSLLPRTTEVEILKTLPESPIDDLDSYSDKFTVEQGDTRTCYICHDEITKFRKVKPDSCGCTSTAHHVLCDYALFGSVKFVS